MILILLEIYITYSARESQDKGTEKSTSHHPHRDYDCNTDRLVALTCM